MSSLQATEQFMVDVKAVASWDSSNRWACAWYRIEDTALGIGQFIPNIVTVRILKGSEAFWRKPRSRVQARSVARGPASSSSSSRARAQQRSRSPPRPVSDGHIGEAEGPDLVDEAADGEDEENDDRGELENLLGEALEMFDKEVAAEELMPEGVDIDAADVPLLIAEGPVAPEASPMSEQAVVEPPAEVALHPPPPVPVAGASGPAASAASGSAASAMRAPPIPHLRGACEATAMFAGGRISFYPSKAAFQANCNNPAHGRCVLTRSCKAKGFRQGGRPLGFLAAWLEDNGQPTKQEHWAFEHLKLTRADRLAQRLLIQGDAQKASLLVHERSREDGEDEEPETLEGLLQ